jgi:hypothetical protein
VRVEIKLLFQVRTIQARSAVAEIRIPILEYRKFYVLPPRDAIASLYPLKHPRLECSFWSSKWEHVRRSP